MCSIGEDDFGDEGGAHSMQEEPSEDPTTDLSNQLCQKCNEKPAVLKLHLKEPQCRECFLHYVRHKFRASLGASKIVRRGSKVLVIYNGSAENVTMLHMIQYGLEQEFSKKLRITPVVLFVSEDFIDAGSERRDQAVKERLDILKQFVFPTYGTVLGSKECCKINDTQLLESFKQDESSFREILEGIKSISSKQDFIVQTRNLTYKYFAQKLECNYVFLSDISLNLSKTLISNIALGRGRSVASDIAFCDDRDEERKIIRPMRDLNPNEIENYLKFIEKQLRHTSFTLPFNDKPSLQNLTSKFVDNLQVSFPSTVSTVFRTGDKLGIAKGTTVDKPDFDKANFLDLFDKSLKFQPTESCIKCKFCHSVLDYENSHTLFATEFSRIVSSRVQSGMSHEEIVAITKKMEEDAVEAVNGNPVEGADELRALKKELCHSCRNIFLDMK